MPLSTSWLFLSLSSASSPSSAAVLLACSPASRIKLLWVSPTALDPTEFQTTSTTTTTTSLDTTRSAIQLRRLTPSSTKPLFHPWCCVLRCNCSLRCLASHSTGLLSDPLFGCPNFAFPFPFHTTIPHDLALPLLTLVRSCFFVDRLGSTRF